MDQFDENNHPHPTPTLDIISALAGLDHILEKVWSALDWRSLRNATLVSQNWNDALVNQSFWKKLIVERAKEDKTFYGRSVSILCRLGKFN